MTWILNGLLKVVAGLSSEMLIPTADIPRIETQLQRYHKAMFITAFVFLHLGQRLLNLFQN